MKFKMIKILLLIIMLKHEPRLEDSNFKTYFSKYFDNLNSNIDEKFLYMTN
jgi:hypothetical protein